jgi:hypothetical protein
LEVCDYLQKFISTVEVARPAEKNLIRDVIPPYAEDVTRRARNGTRSISPFHRVCLRRSPLAFGFNLFHRSAVTSMIGDSLPLVAMMSGRDSRTKSGVSARGWFDNDVV